MRVARSAQLAAFMQHSRTVITSTTPSKCARELMGTKPSNNFQSDRPESGGADRQDERESSGLLARDKQKFAAEQAEKERSSKKRASDEEKEPATKREVNPASRKR
jgi:hypothetical protein